MFKNFTMVQKVAWGFAVPLIVFVIALGLTMWRISGVESVSGWLFPVLGILLLAGLAIGGMAAMEIARASAEIEQRFSAVLEGAANGIILINRSGTITLVNSQIEQIFGYRREELIGQSIEILVPNEIRIQHPALRTGYFNHPEPRRMGANRDLRGVRKDKTLFPVEIGLNPVQFGGEMFAMASVVDISERKAIEREAQERLHNIINGAPNGLLMINREGKIVLVNRTIERIFGYSREELIDRPIEMLVPDKIRGGHVALRSNYFLSPGARSMGAGRDLYGVRKDRTVVPVEIGLDAVQLNGELFALASIVDIAERKQAVAVIAEAAGAISAGDLTRPEFIESADEMGKITAAFNKMVRSLRAIRSQTKALTSEVATASSQIAAGSLQQVASLTQTAASLNEITTTAEEFKTTMQEFVDRARAVQEAATETAKQSAEGRTLTQESAARIGQVRANSQAAGESVLKLAEQMQRIGEITATVNEIADQTKLLALNASIEAARAGEAGRGFAVVATQVRELANQSKEASGRIESLISGTQKSMQDVVQKIENGSRLSEESTEMVRRMTTSFDEIARAIQQTTSAMGQISTGAKQQEVGITELVSSITEIDTASKESLASAEQTRKWILAIDEQIKRLDQTMATF